MRDRSAEHRPMGRRAPTSSSSRPRSKVRGSNWWMRDGAFRDGRVPHLAHQSNGAGRSCLHGSTVARKASAVTRLRCCPLPGERAEWLMLRVVPARGSSIETPLWRPSAFGPDGQEEGIMRTEKSFCEVSVPGGAPPLRPGHRRARGMGRR